MNNKIFLVFKKELREVFRDKKSLSMMLIIPIMIPLLVIGMSAFRLIPKLINIIKLVLLMNLLIWKILWLSL